VRATLGTIVALAALMAATAIEPAWADATASPPPPLVVPVPAVTAVEWPVLDIASTGEPVAGVEDMHFTTASTDGSTTETDDGTTHTYVLTADVMFAYNKAKLTKKAKSTLTTIASKLAATPPAQISVTGFTDSKGPAAANRTLSRKRAKAVATFLAARLGSATTITAVGKGESHPRASNATKAGRALNRRVEITIPS
jgi:outer membrane protein OmpA-like peptidoglycan-associated protein